LERQAAANLGIFLATLPALTGKTRASKRMDEQQAMLAKQKRRQNDGFFEES